MGNEVALHPFHRPSEADRETAPYSARRLRSVSENATTALAMVEEKYRRLKMDLQTVGTKQLDVLTEVSQSGFDMSWQDPYASSLALQVVNQKVWLWLLLYVAVL